MVLISSLHKKLVNMYRGHFLLRWMKINHQHEMSLVLVLNQERGISYEQVFLIMMLISVRLLLIFELVSLGRKEIDQGNELLLTYRLQSNFLSIKNLSFFSVVKELHQLPIVRAKVKVVLWLMQVPDLLFSVIIF